MKGWVMGVESRQVDRRGREGVLRGSAMDWEGEEWAERGSGEGYLGIGGFSKDM